MQCIEACKWSEPIYTKCNEAETVKGRSLFNIQCIEACKGAGPILAKCNEAETVKGGAYLIFSVLKRVKGRSLLQLSAMKHKQ